MPGPASGRRSRISRWAARSPVVQPSQRVGASGPVSASRAHSSRRSARAQFWFTTLGIVCLPPRRRNNRVLSRDSDYRPVVSRRGDLMPQKVTSDILRKGMRVLGVAVRAEPLLFVLSVVFSGLYAAMTVASAWVLGRVTEKVV